MKLFSIALANPLSRYAVVQEEQLAGFAAGFGPRVSAQIECPSGK